MKLIIYILLILVFSGCSSQKNFDKNSYNSIADKASNENVSNKEVKKFTAVDRDIEAGTWNGTTRKLESPLQSAVFHNDLNSLKKLIKNGHDINFVNSEGENLLHVAAQYSGYEMNTFLINYGVDINKRNSIDSSPVHTICRYRGIKLLKLYLDNGVDLKNLGENPIRAILKKSSPGGYEMIELLIDNGFNVNEDYRVNIDLIVAYDVVEYLELLIRKGINFKEIDKNGWTSLHWAAYYNAYNCAKILKKYNQLNRKTKISFEYGAYFGNDYKKIIYQSGLLPIDIAEINKNTETVNVLKQ